VYILGSLWDMTMKKRLSNHVDDLVDSFASD